MTEFDKADLDSNGSIDRQEWNALMLEDKRREMIDEDLKRNAERRFTGICVGRNVALPASNFICFMARF